MTNAEYIKRDLEISGVSKWHSAGFKGKGINILNLEDEGSSHSEMSYRCIYNVVPEANIFRATMVFASDSKSISRHEICDNGVYSDFEEYIKANKIKIISFSMHGTVSPDEPVKAYWLDLQKRYNIIIFNSAGNDAEDAIGTPFSFETAIQVGALIYLNGQPQKANYSNIGDELDFVMLTFGYSGTSFSCPFLAGMAGLLCSRFGDLSFHEVYNYFKNYSLDLGETGDDSWYGWGMPIMPDASKRYITLTVDSTIMTVNGVPQVLDTMPIIDKNNRTLVPIRKPMEALGHKVDWIGTEKKVVIFE